LFGVTVTAVVATTAVVFVREISCLRLLRLKGDFFVFLLGVRVDVDVEKNVDVDAGDSEVRHPPLSLRGGVETTLFSIPPLFSSIQIGLLALVLLWRIIDCDLDLDLDLDLEKLKFVSSSRLSRFSKISMAVSERADMLFAIICYYLLLLLLLLSFVLAVIVDC